MQCFEITAPPPHVLNMKGRNIKRSSIELKTQQLDCHNISVEVAHGDVMFMPFMHVCMQYNASEYRTNVFVEIARLRNIVYCDWSIRGL